MTDKVTVAKNLAKQIALALGQHGQELPHSILLEVVAKAQGARNWHAYQAETEPATVPVKSTVDWSPAHGVMGDDDYLKHRGNRCPFCGSKHHLDAGDIECDGESPTCEVECGNCNSTWTDVYTLGGLGETQPGWWTDEYRRLYAIELWLREDRPDLTADRQEAIDEMVIDTALSFKSRYGSLLNKTIGASEQEEIIEDGEGYASNINNNGLSAQLRFLWNFYDSEDAFIKDIAKECEISVETLKL